MDSIEKLKDLFADFPTIGSRTAGRFVYYLLKQPKAKVNELIQAIQELKSNVKLCSFCFNPHETNAMLCPICQNPARNRQLLCVVEKETDLLSIENTKRYQGLYFILGDTITHFKTGTLPRLPQLTECIKDSSQFGLPKIDFTEIILALNPTVEGRATSALVEKTLKQAISALKITHLAQGLPVGGELEYADDETLESAFEGRK